MLGILELHTSPILSNGRTHCWRLRAAILGRASKPKACAQTRPRLERFPLALTQIFEPKEANTNERRTYDNNETNDAK